MLNIEDFQLRELKQQDLAQVLIWRNSDRVRSNMYSDNIIAQDEHQAWYNRIKSDTSQKHLIFEYRSRAVGLTYFTNMNDQNRKCEWGFYIGETDLPRGCGTILGYLSLNYIFGTERITEVYGEVLDFNKRSQKLFLRLGFTEDGLKKERYMRNNQYHSVTTFTLLRSRWIDVERRRTEQLAIKRQYANV